LTQSSCRPTTVSGSRTADSAFCRFTMTESNKNHCMDFINLLQWPAMVFTIAAAWLVASTNLTLRNWGFWVFLLSNVLWVTWALHDDALALIALQLGLAAMNIRGAIKTETAKDDCKETTGSSD